MNDDFKLRVRSAVSSAWWTVLVAAVFLTFQWIAYLVVMHVRPAWVLSFWGPDVSWSMVQNIWLDATAFFKILVWMMALVALWLSLWSRKMNRA